MFHLKDIQYIWGEGINEKYYRPCEVDLLLGYASKAEKELGWERELDKLIENMF